MVYSYGIIVFVIIVIMSSLGALPCISYYFITADRARYVILYLTPYDGHIYAMTALTYRVHAQPPDCLRT